MSLKPLDPDEIPSYFKALIYGPPGTGKTTWTALNVPDPVWLDFERSTDVLKSMGIKGPKIIPVTPKNNPAEIEAFCKNIDKSEFKTIVFDTISTSQIFQLEDHMAKQSHDLPLFQDYRKSTNFFNKIFYGLQHANINVVLIAHEKDYFEQSNPADPSTKKLVAVGPGVTPALHDSVRALVSGVFRLTRKPGMGKGVGPTWSMQCNQKGLYVAKNRYGITETEIESPTWDTFMKGMN